MSLGYQKYDSHSADAREASWLVFYPYSLDQHRQDGFSALIKARLEVDEKSAALEDKQKAEPDPEG
jgi:hypothetical protein